MDFYLFIFNQYKSGHNGGHDHQAVKSNAQYKAEGVFFI